MDSTFQSAESDFYFGDQEEMGLGVRVASGLRENGGNGRVLNSEGQSGAGNTWGRPARWCDYSGTVGDRWVGVTIMAWPGNLRPSWWHNRDYGLFAANLFGRQAMRQGPPSRIVVQKGETFRLRYGVLIHSSDAAVSFQPEKEFERYLRLTEDAAPRR
jgi:hypothetical protein